MGDQARQPRDLGWWVVSLASVGVCAWLVARAAARAGARNTGDFYHFYEAARAASAGGDIYASGTGGYIYPPLLAALFTPLARLSEVQASWVWLGINVVLTGIAIGLALWFVLHRLVVPGKIARPGPAVALVALLLSVEQLRWEFELGQTDGVLLVAFAFAMVLGRTRPVMAGVLLGFAANVKYLTLIAVPYLLVRRQFKAAGVAIVSTAAWALVPGLVLGWDRNLAYLARALGGLAGAAGVAERGVGDAAPNSIGWHRSVSITSAAARLAESWGMGPAGALAIAGVVALGVLGAVWWVYARGGWSLWRGTTRGDAGGRAMMDALEWTGLIVAVLAFGPQTTTRHMYLMLVPHVVVAGLLLARPRVWGVDRRWVLAGVGVLQLGSRLPPGGVGMDGAVEAWRWVGGVGWCLVVMYVLLVRGALGEATERRSDGATE